MPRFSSSRTSEPSLKRGGGCVNFCSARTPGGVTSDNVSAAASSGSSASSSSAAAAAAAAPLGAPSSLASSSPASCLGASSSGSLLLVSYCSSQPENLSTLPLARRPSVLCFEPVLQVASISTPVWSYTAGDICEAKKRSQTSL